jgi:propane monooxygenase coupling protein
VLKGEARRKINVHRRRPAMGNEAFTLTWIGAEGGCAGDCMDSQRVLSGTRVRIGLRQTAVALRERPQSIFIFPQPEGIVRKIIDKMDGRVHPFAQLQLNRWTSDGYVGMTPPWPVPAVESDKGAVGFYASLDRSGRPTGSSIYSVPYASKRVRKTKGAPEVQVESGGFDVGGLLPKIAVRPRKTRVDEIDVIAAIDPDLELKVLVSGSDEFETYLSTYLNEIAEYTDLSGARIKATFEDEFALAMRGTAGRQLAVSVRPDHLTLAAGEVATVEVKLYPSAATGALIALQIRDIETGLCVTSDMVEVTPQIEHGLVFSVPAIESRSTLYPSLDYPFDVDRSPTNLCGVEFDHSELGIRVANLIGYLRAVAVTEFTTFTRIDAIDRLDLVYDEISHAVGYSGTFDHTTMESILASQYGRMIHEDDRTIIFADPADAGKCIGFDLKPVQW